METRKRAVSRRFVGAALAAALVVAAAVAVTSGHDPKATPAATPRHAMTLNAALAAFSGSTAFLLKVPGVPGESIDPLHPGEIDVKSFNWSITGGALSGGGVGKATFGDVTMEKILDSSSPKLMKAAATGAPFPSVVLTGETSNAEPTEYYQLTLTDSRVRSFKQSGEGEDGVQETVSFSYSTIRLKYTKMSGGTIYQSCWDLVNGKAC